MNRNCTIETGGGDCMSELAILQAVIRRRRAELDDDLVGILADGSRMRHLCASGLIIHDPNGTMAKPQAQVGTHISAYALDTIATGFES